MGTISAQTRPLTTALAAVVFAAGCTSATRGSPGAAGDPAIGVQTRAPAGEPGAGGSGYPHTPADIHFISGMIQHHAQAIVMARWASTHGASPQVRTLAERIINGQLDEIALMQQWLRDRNQPVPEVSPAGTVKTPASEHAMHDMPMHGMLTHAQMNQLEAVRGAEFDRLFLRFMIQHHRGAVAMVEELFSNAGAGQEQTVFKLASDVHVDQSTEVARMERMLAALILEGPAR